MSSFKSLPLSPTMLLSLKRQGYLTPSPVQSLVIPKALKGLDLLIQSETGSGKTLAYLVPLIERIDVSKRKTTALIICPTRELARQTYDFARPFLTEFPSLKISLAGKEKENLTTTGIPHLLITTPGRLLDLLHLPTCRLLQDVKMLVLDEADMLLKEKDLAFLPAFLKKKKAPQTLIVSATLTKDLRNRFRSLYGTDLTLIVDENMTSKSVRHHLIDIRHADLLSAIEDFISCVKPYFLIIFAARKEVVQEVHEALRKTHEHVELLSSEINARERKNTMKRIRLGETQILIATDVAARGLDLPDVSHVLMLDLPPNHEYYHHRAGRTGRYEKKGDVYSFIDADHLACVDFLKEQNIPYAMLALKDHQLVPARSYVRKKKTIQGKDDASLRREIKKAAAMAKARHNKVKPGYKKKVSQAVKKVKRRHKTLLIKEKIRSRKKERKNG